MKKDFGSKSWLYPMPVLIVAAYDEQGVPNVMNAAWGGIFTDETIGICLSAGHKTTKNILATRAFTVSMATVDQVAACDYAGIVSGNKVPDKFARAGFHATPSAHVNAPMIDELPMTLECELLSYDPASCHLTGRIVNISADESILTDGQIDLRKLRPICYDPIHLEYIELGGYGRQGLLLRQKTKIARPTAISGCTPLGKTGLSSTERTKPTPSNAVGTPQGPTAARSFSVISRRPTPMSQAKCCG